ncbi:MAG: nitrogenase reductase [Clostridia bacterium]|nr:nitrogenase reductase [Clostridia bacterium]
MPKMLVVGRGGSGKSTLVVLLARRLGEKGKVLVVDADESNLGLGAMLGVEPPRKTLIDYLGGKPAVREKLMAMLKGEGSERVELFTERLTLDGLPSECVRWDGSIAFMQVGKIEHSMEGCACPMGAVARAFLNHLAVEDGEWVLVDTEAGVEHFGRGVLEGVDAVLMVVDPSHDAVVLAEKAARLAREAKKDFGVALNKVDEKTEPVLKEMLAAKGIEIKGVLPYSPAIAQASLLGGPLEGGAMREEVDRLVSGIGGMLEGN